MVKKVYVAFGLLALAVCSSGMEVPAEDESDEDCGIPEHDNFEEEAEDIRMTSDQRVQQILSSEDNSQTYPLVVLIGGCGAGKSQLGDIAAGETICHKRHGKTFKIGWSMDRVRAEAGRQIGEAETKKCQFRDIVWKGSNLKVALVDTPGLDDTGEDGVGECRDTEIIQNAVKYVKRLARKFGGVSAFIIVIPIDWKERFKDSAREAMQLYARAFPGFWNYGFMAITKRELNRRGLQEHGHADSSIHTMDRLVRKALGDPEAWAALRGRHFPGDYMYNARQEERSHEKEKREIEQNFKDLEDFIRSNSEKPMPSDEMNEEAKTRRKESELKMDKQQEISKYHTKLRDYERKKFAHDSKKVMRKLALQHRRKKRAWKKKGGEAAKEQWECGKAGDGKRRSREGVSKTATGLSAGLAAAKVAKAAGMTTKGLTRGAGAAGVFAGAVWAMVDGCRKEEPFKMPEQFKETASDLSDIGEEALVPLPAKPKKPEWMDEFEAELEAEKKRSRDAEKPAEEKARPRQGAQERMTLNSLSSQLNNLSLRERTETAAKGKE